MIGSFIFLAVFTAVLVGTAALALEWALRSFGKPARWAWIGAIFLSTVLPFWRTLTPLAPIAQDVATVEQRRDADQRLQARSLMAKAVRLPAQISVIAARIPDRAQRFLGLSWVLVSCGLAAYFASAIGALRNVVRASEQRHGFRLTSDVGPATYGICNPIILMPQWVLEMPAESVAAVLAHEHEHVAARDALWVLVGLSVLIAFPWNVAMWWQVRRLRLAIEVDCDARVLRRGTDARRYGETLLEVARQIRGRSIAILALGEGNSQLLTRVAIMLTPVSRFKRGLGAVAALMSIGCLAAAAQLPVPANLEKEENAAAARQLEMDCDQVTGKGRQVIYLSIGNEFREVWPVVPGAVHPITMPNGFRVGVRIDPVSESLYAQRRQPLDSPYVAELLKITLLDLHRLDRRMLTSTFAGSNSIQVYSAQGGADAVAELGEPGITMMLMRPHCVAVQKQAHR